MSQEKFPRWSRREVLQTGAKAALGTALVYNGPGAAIVDTAIAAETLAETGSMKEAVAVYKSKLVFPPEQGKRLADPRNDTFWLAFPGLGGRSAENVAKAVTPALGRDGRAVGFVEYSVDGVNMREIAEGFVDLQKQYPHLKKIGIYGHSNGTHSAGGAFNIYRNQLGGEMEIAGLIIDGSPVDAESTRLAVPATVLDKMTKVHRESVTLTALTNLFIFHKPLASKSAPPLLLMDQVKVMQHGEKYIDYLASLTSKGNSEVYFIRATDPYKDPIDDPDKAEATYRKKFGKLTVIKMRGEEEGHANPDVNVKEYDKQLREHVLVP